jgi:hypothetical protein
VQTGDFTKITELVNKEGNSYYAHVRSVYLASTSNILAQARQCSTEKRPCLCTAHLKESYNILLIFASALESAYIGIVFILYMHTNKKGTTFISKCVQNTTVVMELQK